MRFESFITQHKIAFQDYSCYYSHLDHSLYIDCSQGLSALIKKIFFTYVTFGYIRQYAINKSQLKREICKVDPTKVNSRILTLFCQKFRCRFEEVVPIFYQVKAQEPHERLQEYLQIFWRANNFYTPSQLNGLPAFKKLVAEYKSEFGYLRKGPIDFLGMNNPQLPTFRGFQSLHYKEDENFKKILAMNLPFSFHGVQQAHGGMKILVNIMLSSILFANWTGKLLDIHDRSFTATSHGPYFVLIDTDAPFFFLPPKDIAYPFHLMLAFIVPSEKERLEIENYLDKAVEQELIKTEDKETIKNRILTYEELANIPLDARRSIRAFKQCLAL